MTAAQFLRALDDIGCLTYDQAAATLGVGRRSLVRYGVGDQPVPPVVERMLILLRRHGVPDEWRG